MKPGQIKAFAKVMQECGLSYLKTDGLELRMARSPSPQPLVKPRPIVTPVHLSEEEKAEIKHKVEEMASVMKLGDDDLLERLFPLPEMEEA